MSDASEESYKRKYEWPGDAEKRAEERARTKARWEAEEAQKAKDFPECRDFFMLHIPELHKRVMDVRAEEGHRESGRAESFRCHNPRCGHTTRLGTLRWYGFRPSRGKFSDGERLIYMRCEKCGLYVREETSSSMHRDNSLYYSCGCSYEQSPEGWMKFYRCKDHRSPGKVETKVIVIEEPTLLAPPGISYTPRAGEV